MKKNSYTLWEPAEYNYAEAYGFVPNLHSYVHDEDDTVRPCILVVPGGAYFMVSPTEAELIALKFYNMGYNAFVCTYTVNTLRSEPLKKQPMKDLSRAIRFIRKNSAEFHVHPNKIALCGFSAGGHLCGSICVHYEDIKDMNSAYAAVSNRPDAAILSYPVITSGEMAHQDSFVFLLGEDATVEEMNYMSLEKQVKSNTPPCFLWHTATDELVPVENSILFAEACKESGVPFALHIFSDGPHGLSLANCAWGDGQFGDRYPNAQMVKVVEKIQSGEISVSPETTRNLVSLISDAPEKRKPNEEVAAWPELAYTWLKRIWND